ncbi:hypothetical protein L209DRAFT_752799 [Thermothelomyces heterothallicus CBS 203.75]
MGTKVSKISCSCTISCHPHGAVHHHRNEVGPCPRCGHLSPLRPGAESRASAASTSTEYLARPRYYSSPSLDLTRPVPCQRTARRPRRRPTPDEYPDSDESSTPTVSVNSPPPSRPPSAGESSAVRYGRPTARAARRSSRSLDQDPPSVAVGAVAAGRRLRRDYNGYGHENRNGTWNGYENDGNLMDPETGEDGRWAGDHGGDRDATGGSPDSQDALPQPLTPSNISRSSTVV